MISLTSGKRLGFFYQYEYFILQEEGVNAADFLNRLRSRKLPVKLEVIMLSEEPDEPIFNGYERGVCMAPYFITDHITDTMTIEIDDPDDLFPTEVELLTQQEYNARLRAQVEQKCGGCCNFHGITEEDSSLSGHFSEIALNGACVYRCELPKEPRNFYLGLHKLANHWDREGFGKGDVEPLLRALKTDVWLTYSGAERVRGGVLLHVKKPDFFTTVLTEMVNYVLAELRGPKCMLELQEQMPITENAVKRLFTPEKLSSTLKSLKRYGVAVAELTFDEGCEMVIAPILNALTDMGVACALFGTDHSVTWLVLDECAVLNHMRYSSPVLTPCHTQITMTNAWQTARWQVDFTMPCTVVEHAV